MSIRVKIEKQIKRKELEIQGLVDQKKELDSDIRDTETFIKGLQEALKHLPKEKKDTDTYTVRSGSDVDKVLLILQNHGKPLRIEDILKNMGKEVNKHNRANVASQLSHNYREGRIFTRPAPNTFGLLAWGDNQEIDDLAESGDLPNEFGSMKSVK